MKRSIVLRTISFLIATLFVFSLVACGEQKTDDEKSGGTTKSEGKQETTTEAKKADPFEKYDPSITVTSVKWDWGDLKFKEGESIDNNAWSRAYMDNLGITIKYDWIAPATEFWNKLNVVVVSGDLPDMFPVLYKDLKQLTESGAIEDLTEAYETYAAPLTKEVVKQDETFLNVATFDDKIMAIPQMGNSPYAMASVLYLRTDWLENCNLPEPKTMEDIYNISKAFTENDPDQNGKKDTYGLGLSNDSMVSLVMGIGDLSGFLAGYNGYNNGWLEDNSGNLYYGGIQPEVKTGLVKLQQMYEEGLIDPEWGTKDRWKVMEDVNANRIGMFYGIYWAPAVADSTISTNPEANWKAFPLPSVDGKPAPPMQIHGAPNAAFFVVKKGFKHPEAIVKIWNLEYELSIGETSDPEKYVVAPDATNACRYKMISVSKECTPNYIFEKYLSVNEAFKNNETSKLNSEDRNTYNLIKLFIDGDRSKEPWIAYGEYYGEDSAVGVLYNNYLDGVIKVSKYIAPPTKTMIDKGASIDKIQQETYSRIIMGESPDEFDEFVANWKKLGGDEITQEVNEWYKANK